MLDKSIWFNPRFFVYASGNIINNFGNSFFTLALPLLIYDLTGSSIQMSLMMACELLPMLFSPLIGAVVDRVSSRTIIFSSLSFQALCSAMIPLLYQSGHLQIWMLYLFGALLSFGGICLRTGQFVVVPYMFPERRIEASAALSTGFTITTIFGPFLAGWLLAMTSYGTLLWINSLTFFAPILLCIYTKIPNQKRESINRPAQILEDMREGLAYLKNDKLLLRFFIIMATATLAGSGGFTIIVYHFKYMMHLSDHLVSWFMIALGFGDFIGTLLPRRLMHINKMKLLTVFYLSSAIGSSLFLIPAWWIAPIALIASAIGGSAAGVCLNLQMQETVPLELLGRVSATNRAMLSTTATLSPILFGTVAHSYSSYAAFGLMSVLYLLPTAISFLAIVKVPTVNKITSQVFAHTISMISKSIANEKEKISKIINR